ncbi:G protein-coupled receptor rhodopsin-like [Trinorchestia longiramus]|nr:G protein-coupled receptor rhodopsin-like [Trinorchestia longiramus]
MLQHSCQHTPIFPAVRTERNAVYAIVCTWTIILVSCVPIYIAHGIKVHEWGNQKFEYCTFLTKEYSHAAFRIGFICTMFFIPVVAMVFLYVKILHRLWKRNRPGGMASAESLRSKKRVTQMVVIVVVTFVVCWFPIQMVLLLKSLHVYEMNAVGVIFQVGAQALAYTNSCLNPILYAFLSDPFRKAFRKVIYFNPRRRSDGQNHLDLAAFEENGPSTTRFANVFSFKKTTTHRQSHSTGQSNNELTELKNTLFHQTTSSNNTDVSNLCEMVYCGPTQLAAPPKVDDDQMRQLKLSERPLLPTSESDPLPSTNNNNGTMQRINGAFCAAQDAVHSSYVYPADLAELNLDESVASNSRQLVNREVKQKVPPAVPPRGSRPLGAHKSSDSIGCSNWDQSLSTNINQKKRSPGNFEKHERSSEVARHSDDTPLLCRQGKTDDIS